jgi:hypothetical protein
MLRAVNIDQSVAPDEALHKGARRCEKRKRARTKFVSEIMAGETGLEPATFGVTGRTKFNGINDSCKFFCG